MNELLEKMAYCSGTNKPTGKFRRHRRFLHLPIKWRGNWWKNSFIEDQKRVMKLWAPQGILLHLHHNCHQLCLLKERKKLIGAHIFVSFFYAAADNFLQEVSSKRKLCYVMFLIVCLPYIVNISCQTADFLWLFLLIILDYRHWYILKSFFTHLVMPFKICTYDYIGPITNVSATL